MLNPSLMLLAYMFIVEGSEPEVRPLGFDEAVYAVGLSMDLYQVSQKLTADEVRTVYLETKDSPPLDAVVRLPSRLCLEHNKDFADTHLTYLREYQKLWPRKDLSTFIARTDDYRQAMSLLIQAQAWSDHADFWCVVYARGYIRRAEVLLGVQVRDGFLPPITDYGYFRTIR